MADLAGIMRRLADEIEREDQGDKSKATEDRIAALEEQLAKAKRARPADVDDAFEEISDEELELIREHRKGKTAPPPPAPAPEPEPVVEQKTRPGRKKGKAYAWTVDDDGGVVKTDIAHIYSGDDEPDEVPLPAGEAAAA